VTDKFAALAFWALIIGLGTIVVAWSPAPITMRSARSSDERRKEVGKPVLGSDLPPIAFCPWCAAAKRAAKRPD
jgi:hypothetical protein